MVVSGLSASMISEYLFIIPSMPALIDGCEAEIKNLLG
jgi:hypothetical protein